MIFSRSCLTDPLAITSLANRLSNYPKVGLDTESSGPNLPWKKSSLNLFRSDLSGISLALPGDWPESFYIPVSHKRGNAPLPAVARLLEAISDYRGVFAIHNVKHELYSMDSGPVPFAGFSTMPHCTEVLAWLLNLGAPGKPPKEVSYGLKRLAKHSFELTMSEFADVTNGYDFSQLDPASPLSLNYACEDAEAALRLHDWLYPQLAEFPGMEDTYLNVELPLIGVLRHMEDAGMGFDAAQHELLCADLDARVKELEEEWEFRWPGLNINSTQQMQYFFDNGHWSKKLAVRKATGYSCEAETVSKQLAACREGSEGWHAARLKMGFAELFKLQTAFGRSLIDKVSAYPDGRIHGSYFHTGTATGRLAAADPNLMQIPTRTEEGRKIRESFIAAPGWKMVSADYSQIELRVLAHFNGAGTLYEGYKAGADVHRMTASRIYGKRPEDVTDAERGVGKTVNFLIVYGGGARKLADKAKLSLPEAKRILVAFKETNPETFDTLGRAQRAAERKGYVRTFLNRIRRLKIRERRAHHDSLKATLAFGDEKLKDAWLLLGKEERRAGNTPIQGGARDIITLGMISFFRQMDHSRCRIVGQVHDDLITEMREDYIEEGTQLKKECLENAYELRVPLVVEPKVAQRWSGLK